MSMRRSPVLGVSVKTRRRRPRPSDRPTQHAEALAVCLLFPLSSGRLLTLALALVPHSHCAGGKQPGERQIEILTRKVAVSANGATADGQESVAVFAAGCFWGVELAFARLPGVLRTEVGYVGGRIPNPNYKSVSRGDTMHAEAVRVYYDSSVLTFEDLFGVFFDCHDPTTRNRQGGDVGTQYRSAVFYSSDDERNTAGGAIYREQARLGGREVVTTLEPLGEFTVAEDYHRT